MRNSDDHEISLISGTAKLATVPGVSSLIDANTPRFFWETPDEPTVLAGGAATKITVDGSKRFQAVREYANTVCIDWHSGNAPIWSRPRFLGGFSFRPISTRTGDSESVWRNFHDAQFVVPRVQITAHEGVAWVTLTEAATESTARDVERRLRHEKQRLEEPSRFPSSKLGISVQYIRDTPEKNTWKCTVEQLTEDIQKTGLEKVVLAQRRHVQFDKDVPVSSAFSRLGDHYPSCTRFLVDPVVNSSRAQTKPAETFLGATPEFLLKLRDTRIETAALAGTFPRGQSEAADAKLRRTLRNNAKESHEHDLVVDSVTSRLRQWSTNVTVGPRRVRRLANMQHLESPITATTSSEIHILRLVEALHPTPAVGGLPIYEAMNRITRFEAFDRGWYAAPIGWFDLNGGGSFSVGLRSAVVTGSEASCYAGVGVVSGSDPDSEWNEVTLKNQAILRNGLMESG